MRKQRAAARGLIDEFVAQRRRVDRNEQQVVLTFEMREAVSTTWSRVEKMNEPVGEIDGAPANGAGPARFLP